MKKRAIFGFMSAAAIALFTLATPAVAVPVSQTINLDQVFTGNTPDGPAPWLTATFTYDVGSTTGTLVLQSNLSDSDFVQGAMGVTGWGFNIDQTLASFNCTSGTCADTVLTSGVNSGPVPGGFNLGFGWTSQNRFDGSDTATYLLTFDSALDGTSPFVANGSGWLSFAHIQGITGDCSGFIVSGTGTLGTSEGPCHVVVPEPEALGSLGMFGLGALLIGVFLGMRRRYC
ncbi:MAG TPA: hypothetical protein VIM92_11315 [Rhodanobacteraceae bacterium]